MDLNEIKFREPKISDLQKCLFYINELSKEKTFIIQQGEIITEKAERYWIKDCIKKIKEGRAVFLLAFYKDELLGISQINLGHGASEHVGDFAISVAKKYRGKGVGSLLMDKILFEAQKRLKKLKIIRLEAFADNDIAISLYKKKGFIKFGEMPKGYKRRGKYNADIYMCKEII